VHGETKEIGMEIMSFGAGAGHLMERLLENAGVTEISVNTVRIAPEAGPVALDILREAWAVELLDADDEPDAGNGDQIHLCGIERGEIYGETLNWETAMMDGGYLRLDLRKVEKVHVF
jgi:hypothetical protein